MRVAIYTRVSTSAQAEDGYSLSAQERTLRNYCTERGHEIYRIYTDEGISGKDIKHRPAMRELLVDAETGCYDVILVWALSRLTRSVADLYHTWERIAFKNIGLISYTESFDASTPTGRAMMGLLGVFAQMEREITAERVLAAMDERARQGLRTCPYVLGYDVIKGGGMSINRQEADAVRYIYHTYLEQQSIIKTVDICRRSGIRGKRGAVLDCESIHKILTRFVYVGYYSWHRKPIKGDYEPIIDAVTYNHVQDILTERGLRYGRNRKKLLVKIQL